MRLGLSALILVTTTTTIMPGSTDASLDKQQESPKSVSHDEKVPDQETDAVVAAEFPNVDEAKVLRKMDVRLIPMLSLLYLLAFLDRGNIGNAKIEGLLGDLNLTGQEFNWTCMSLFSPSPFVLLANQPLLIVTVFFFTYCVFELPSNLLLKKLRPSRWLPLIMVAWGIVMVSPAYFYLGSIDRHLYILRL